MLHRYTAHVVTVDGPKVMTVYADSLFAADDVVRFHCDGKVVKKVPATAIRALFCDDNVPIDATRGSVV
jgi:hypothetical protein